MLPALIKTNPALLKRGKVTPLFSEKFNSYEPDATDTAFLKNMRTHLSFIIAADLRTSAGENLLARFFKLMNCAGINSNRITLCNSAAGENQSPAICEKYRITKIPTIIVLYKNRPLIKIEGPVKGSIETDIAERMREIKRFIIF